MFSEFDKACMRLAIDEAHNALYEGEIPVGCVLAEGESVLKKTHNRCEELRDITAHAEMLAIKGVDRQTLRASTLYVTLEPCPMCAGALALSGIKRIVFGASDKKYGCCGSVYRLTEDPAFPAYSPAYGGLYAEECASLLAEGFDKLRSKTRE